jgi:hypothetical protein
VFQAGSSAVDSATIVSSLVHQLAANVFAVGASSAILRLGLQVKASNTEPLTDHLELSRVIG